MIFKGIGIDTFPGFFDPCVEALGMTGIIKPRSFLESDRVDDELVSLPFGDRVSIPGRTKIFEVLT